MKTLLVVDMLEDFFKEGLLSEVRAELTLKINTLIRQSREREIPVIWVRQEFRKDLSDAFPVMRKNNIHITISGTKGCEVLSELDKDKTELEIVKKRYSAFFETELENHLKKIGTTELILAGVNTHACIRTAAIDAYQRDFEVTIPIECVSSYDTNHHEVTLKYLDGHIAKLISLENIWNPNAL